MNVEIFIGLIGIPVGIILLAVTFYVVQAKKDQAKSIEVNQEKEVSQ